MNVYWPGVCLTLIAVASGVFMCRRWLRLTDPHRPVEDLEAAMERVVPYDVTMDNWLEVSHYVSWLESLPECDEPGVTA